MPFHHIWKDDKVMSAMMYTFRPREVNEEHYEQKMQFWKDLIESYCEYKGAPTITINELKDVFKRKGTSPYCLQDILNQMMYEGNLQEKNLFMEQPKATWGSWMVDSLIYKPASWGFSKIKEKIIGSSTSPDTVFIVKSSVQKQARLLQEHVRNRHTFNNIISMDDLMESAENIDGLSREGILMALQHLNVYSKSAYIEENNHSLGVEDSSDNHHHKLLIKFGEPHQTVLPITEMERSIYNLEHTEKYLLDVVNKKKQQLNELLLQVKNSLAEGKKQMAKTFLRKKHVCESELTKTMNILENIQTMLQRIQNSKSDKEIIKMYKMGSDSIKHIFANNGINLDSVHDIIEDMKEVIEEQEECQSALSAPMRGLNEIDESDIESELMDLIKENKKEEPKPSEVIKNKPDVDIMDLEMRLRKLRGDFPDLDESDITPVRSQKSLPQI
ncbi:charged multivesicular body protein 7 isoform X2 [Chironomus tepperi]|uniref:charged multivesicular body protein 7 isoform X2 n=1 Tax=Chironomus tepperi TaxID=113505 RepID=UPI00391F4BC7